MSVAILYYCPEYEVLYYLIDNQYYTAESLSPITLKDELELIELVEVDSNGYITCNYQNKLLNGKITNVGKRFPSSKPIFIKTTTGWTILSNTILDSGVFNSIYGIGANKTFDGYIEYMSDIHLFNLPDLNSSLNKLKLPEFNLLLFHQLILLQRNKIPLFDILLVADTNGSLIRFDQNQPVLKDIIYKFIINPTKIVKIKNTSNYSQYRDLGILTDVTFRVGNTQIKAHKIILANVSDYFMQLFIGSFRESNQDIITINETNPKAFEVLIKAIYEGDCSNLNWDILLEVVILIQRYQITKFNIKNLLKKVEIPSSSFIKLIETINSLYDEITPDLVDIVASKIKTEIDLSSLSTEFIKALLTSSHYLPVNSSVTRNILTNLKDKGIDITL